MSIPYEKAVGEDLNLGHGTVTVTNPGGGTLTGNKIGIHTLLGVQVFNALDFGSSPTAAIDAAITALGGLPGIIIVPPSMAAGAPTSVPSTVTIWDLRGGTPLSSAFNNVGTNVADSGAVYHLLDEHYSSSPTKSVVAVTGFETVTGALPASQSMIGVLGQCNTTGTLSAAPSGLVVIGVEATASIGSTGQTLPDVRGITANATVSGSTNVTQMAMIYGQSLASPGAGDVTNLYTCILEGQTLGLTKNFSLWSQGEVILTNGASTNGNSIWSMTSAGNPVFVMGFGVGATDLMLMRPISNTVGWRWTNQANSADWFGIVNAKVGVKSAAAAPASVFDVQDDAQVNDATNTLVRMSAGSDGTLGPLVFSFKHHPSATGTSRFVALDVGDNSANRLLVLQPTAGGVSISKTTNAGNTLEVNGPISFAGNVVSVAASNIAIGGQVQSTVGAAGGASALPATPLGYIIIKVASTDAVIPYYVKA